MLRPRHWGGHLLLVVALVATTWLGFWQLSAWQHGREAEARDLSEAAPLALTDAMGPDDPFPGQYVGQPVELRGTWVPASTLYVADRLRDGERGYWVMTPVIVDGGDGSAVPVVRGWSPTADADAVGIALAVTADPGTSGVLAVDISHLTVLGAGDHGIYITDDQDGNLDAAGSGPPVPTHEAWSGDRVDVGPPVDGTSGS